MKAFHAIKSPWAKIKHSILGNYLPLFANKLARLGSPVYLVDGFAGGGRYGDGQEGSALITANTILHPRTPDIGKALRCINVEKNADSYVQLQEATSEHASLGLVQNIRGEFHKLLPSILEQIDICPALFFIDPFGAKAAGASTLRMIAQRKRKPITEALVRFDDNRVKRLIRYNSNDLAGTNPQAVKTAESFLKLARELTGEEGITATNWQKPNAGEIIVESYKKLIVDDLHLFKFGLTYPVVNPNTKGHRYYLAHFCNHEDGYVHMASFMAVVQRLVDDIKTSQKEMDFFAPQTGQLEIMEFRKEEADQYQDAVVHTVAEMLPNILKRAGMIGKTVQRRHVYAAIVDTFSWTVKVKESAKALLIAQEQGHLTLREGSKDYSKVTIHQSPS